ncbi:MAG: type II secretion system protein, partial [Verrucomicrobiota bacterium]
MRTPKYKKMKMQIQRIKQARNQGFTLVELLVVVAIIAVIGAGVAVTYQKLDEQAKTAMEISDMAILKKVVKHWSSINDYALPDELDSLVDTEGNLYTSFSTHATPSSGGNGLLGPIGYATLEAQDAPDVVINNLRAGGMNFVYTHLPTRTPANDSTFETSDLGTFTFGSSVNTSNTKSTLLVNAADVEADNQDFIDNSDGTDATHDYATNGSYTYNAAGGTAFGPYNTEAEWTTAVATAQDLVDSNPVEKLAFVYPGNGTIEDLRLEDGSIYSPLELFPGGFTPRFEGEVTDYSATVGVRGVFS